MDARLLPIVALATLAACAVASPPVIAREADEATRRRVYENHRLTYHGSFLGKDWTRADGRYPMRGLSRIAEPYPEARAILAAGRRRELVMTLTGGVGGGIMLGTLFYNLSAPEDSRATPEEKLVFYGAGAALVVTAVIISLLWDDPLDRFHTVYNDNLRRDLALPDPAAPLAPPPATSVGYGWRY